MKELNRILGEAFAEISQKEDTRCRKEQVYKDYVSKKRQPTWIHLGGYGQPQEYTPYDLSMGVQLRSGPGFPENVAFGYRTCVRPNDKPGAVRRVSPPRLAQIQRLKDKVARASKALNELRREVYLESEPVPYEELKAWAVKKARIREEYGV